MARGRGGRRIPDRPAPVSGPGALSERTDGGPGSESQPVRQYTGLGYGEGGALTAQQQAAPLAAGGTPTPSAGSGPAPPSPPGPAGLLDGLQAGPHMPVDPAGKRMVFQDDPDALLRALAQVHPHPDIYRLIREGL